MVMLIDAPDPFGHGTDGRADGPMDGRTCSRCRATGDLAALYHRAILGEADLPGLLFDDRRVPTWSVDVNLVAYAWAPEHARARSGGALRRGAGGPGRGARGRCVGAGMAKRRAPPGHPEPRSARPWWHEALERRAATLARLRERERPADIPETLARVPRVRTVGDDGRPIDPLGDGAGAGGPGGLFGELEALLRPAAAPSPAE